MRAFAAGDRVHIATLGTGVVREVRSGGRYVVELKGRSVVVQGARIEPAPDARRAAAREDRSADAGGGAAVRLSLDLHGKTAAEAVDVLDAFLNDALLAGATEVRVIHGRSGGVLKAAVHRRLKQLPPVRSVRLDPENPGVTIVRL